MNRLFLILVPLTFLLKETTILACLNDGGAEYSMRKESGLGEDQGFAQGFQEARNTGYPRYFQSIYTRKDWEKHLLRLESKLKETANPDFDLLTSYGVALVHLGEYQRALTIFQNLEKEKPGFYQTASNLGTTYELLGDDKSALKWIQEGLIRNPASHQGTEWLHVKILETKLQLANDPRWLQTHSVLGFDWGNNWWAAKPQGPHSEPKHLALALHHQLNERLQFIDAPDQVVGDLLYDLANLAALETDPVHAKNLFKMSLVYQPPKADIARNKLSYYSFRASFREFYDFANGWTITLSLWGLVLFSVYRYYRWYKDQHT